MYDYKVVCIRRGSALQPHTAITHIGCEVGPQVRVVAQADAIAALLAAQYALHTYVQGVRAKVVVAAHNGHNYLKTEADGFMPNNLLALPECAC